MARRATRGPCSAVSRGRQAGQRESTEGRLLFTITRTCCRKAQTRLTDLPGSARAWMPELSQRRSGCPMGAKRQAGCPSLLVTFLLATQEKVTRAAERVESSSLSPQRAKSVPLTPALYPSQGRGRKGARQKPRQKSGPKRRAKKEPAKWRALSHQRGVQRLTPATRDSAAAQMPLDRATGRRRKFLPAPAAGSPDPWPWLRRLRSRRA